MANSGASGKEHTCQCGRCKRCGFDPLGQEDPLEEGKQLTLVVLPGEFHGQSLASHGPHCRKESDTTEST